MPAGNLFPFSKLTVIQRVKAAWNIVSEEIVRKSLKVIGIALNPDGSEDEQIRCIQEGAVEAAAKDEIAWLNSALARHDEEESDLFADIDEDGDELKENEIIIVDELP